MGELKDKNTVARWLIRRKFYFLLPFGLLAVLLISLSTFLLPVSSGEQTGDDRLILVPPQATATQVGELLQQNGLVRNAVAFTLWARWKGQDQQIQAGEYQLSSGLSTPQVLAQLTEGRQVLQAFTVPEGFTTAQIADLLVGKGLASRDLFYEAVINEDYPHSFLQGVPKNEKRLEGYLLPDTYQITRGTSEIAIIQLMLDRFQQEIDELDYPALMQGQALSLHQAVTIASLIEREAKFDQEKPLIAGVIHNRLAISMRLQIDATVQYALGATKPVLSYKDLEVDSPYNTYQIPGLPLGPIAMPGRASLLAAVQPAVSDYYYYVAKPDGYHAFAKTLDGHEANKEMYLQ